MTDPIVPDVSFSGLIDRLPDNNAGAIGPEDVRAIASHSRSISAIVGVSDVGNTSLYGKFNTTDAAASTIIEDITSGIRYAKLLSLLDVSGATKYEKYTGSVQSAVSASTTYGITYGTGTTEQPYTQSRAFQYDWDILLEGTDQSYFALTFYYLPNGTSWPTTGTGWGDLKIHHSEALYGASEVDGDKFHSASSGSKTIVLNPGDTLVPVLEYWGSRSSSSYALSNLSGANKTGVDHFSLTISSSGVVGSDTDWDADTDYWSVSSNRLKVVKELEVAGSAAALPSGTYKSLSVKVGNRTSRPATDVAGQPYIDTEWSSGSRYRGITIYNDTTGAAAGWQRPWNLPWGIVGHMMGAGNLTYAGSPYTGTSQAPNNMPAYTPPQTTGYMVSGTPYTVLTGNFNWFADRRLLITGSVQVAATPIVASFSLASSLSVGGTVVETPGGVFPSTTVGGPTARGAITFRAWAWTTTDTTSISLSVTGTHASGGTNTVYIEGMRLMIEDLGPIS